MQGTRVLPVLLALAVAAGFVIHFASRQDNSPAPGGADPLAEAVRFVEAESGLTFRAAPAPATLATEGALVARIESFLDSRFGPSGLAHRTRALELLGVLPPGQNLRGQLLAAEAAGVRAWFNDLDGTLSLAPGFDPGHPPDLAALVNGFSRLLLYQHHGPVDFRSDDHWLAWRGVSGGLAASVEAAFRRSRPAETGIPTAAETEREATLMSMPIYLHGIAQFPVFEGKDFLELPGFRPVILGFPPVTTGIFFHDFRSADELREGLEALAKPPPPGESSPVSLPPGVSSPSLVESLGALGVRLYIERHGDFEQATTLATHLQADSYVLFSTSTGDHLRWTARFASPSDAELARSLLDNWLQEPVPPGDQRFKRIDVSGDTITVFNYSEPVGDP